MRHFPASMRGLGMALQPAEATSIQRENAELTAELERLSRIAMRLVDAPFVTSHESIALAQWLARRDAIRPMLMNASYTTMPSGTVDVNQDASNYAFHARPLIRAFSENGFDEVARRATTRTAATGFVLVATIGGALWYVSARSKKRSGHG